MPKKRNGHWYIGGRKYKSKAAAVRSYRAYKAQEHHHRMTHKYNNENSN